MLFNYNTIVVNLSKETKSIEILLNRPELENAINVEMLFELESLFGWLANHIEINAVVLSSTSDFFCSGFDQNEMKIMSEEKLKKYITRFQKLLHSILHLPQSIICDLQTGACGMGLELSLAADMRIARESCEIHFNALNKGWTSCAGLVGLMGQLVGHARARQWVLASCKINSKGLQNSGLVLELYPKSGPITQHILQNILTQAPVARIQTKRSLLEAILPELERAWEYESAFAFANLESEDWKKADSNDFLSARDMKKKIQEQQSEA